MMCLHYVVLRRLLACFLTDCPLVLPIYTCSGWHAVSSGTRRRRAVGSHAVICIAYRLRLRQTLATWAHVARRARRRALRRWQERMLEQWCAERAEAQGLLEVAQLQLGAHWRQRQRRPTRRARFDSRTCTHSTREARCQFLIWPDACLPVLSPTMGTCSVGCVLSCFVVACRQLRRDRRAVVGGVALRSGGDG